MPSGGAARDLNVGDAIGYGWNVYWKNVGTLIVIALVVFAINVVVSLVGTALGGGVVVQAIVQFIGFLVGMLLSLGWLRVSLEITRGVKPEVGDLFKVQGYGPYLLASILFAIGFYIGLILLIVPGIIFACVFGFYGFVIAERGEGVGVMESLQRSADITRGHRWQLFGLGVVIFLINIVGVIACFVGLLFTLGISILAWAYAYRTLSGEMVERSAWT
ncbi:MAG: hypothetical protein ABW033_08695 [Acidimicrobiia bacterium]